MFFLTRAAVLRALGCADLPPRVDDLLGAIGVGWGGGIFGGSSVCSGFGL